MSNSIDAHIKAYADLFIAKFESITGDYREPWLQTLPFVSQNAAGHLYSGVNDVNLSLTAALRGFSCPVWLSGAQCRDLGVLRRSGESGMIVYWGGTSFIDKDRGAVDNDMRWADYQKLSTAERERYQLRESYGNYSYVWNIEQTDFPEQHPDTWANLRQLFSREHIGAQCDLLDHFLAGGSWAPDGSRRCPIVQMDGGVASYNRAVRFIELPRKDLFQDERNFYNTLLHTMAHSAIVEQAVASYKGDGDPLADVARLNLSSELAAAVVAGRLGLSQSLSDSNLRYMREWTQVLSDDPSIIRQVTRDSRYAVQLISEQVGIPQPQAINLCDTLGAELLRAKFNTKETEQRSRKVYDSINTRTGKPRLGRRNRL
jgi:antirestriction protein ArdC